MIINSRWFYLNPEGVSYIYKTLSSLRDYFYNPTIPSGLLDSKPKIWLSHTIFGTQKNVDFR